MSLPEGKAVAYAESPEDLELVPRRDPRSLQHPGTCPACLPAAPARGSGDPGHPLHREGGAVPRPRGPRDAQVAPAARCRRSGAPGGSHGAAGRRPRIHRGPAGTPGRRPEPGDLAALRPVRGGPGLPLRGTDRHPRPAPPARTPALHPDAPEVHPRGLSRHGHPEELLQPRPHLQSCQGRGAGRPHPHEPAPALRGDDLLPGQLRGGGTACRSSRWSGTRPAGCPTSPAALVALGLLAHFAGGLFRASRHRRGR